MASSSPLLDLPAELGNRIYQWVFADEFKYSATAFNLGLSESSTMLFLNEKPFHHRHNNRLHQAFLGLATCCKLTSSEVQPVFWDCANWKFIIDDDLESINWDLKDYLDVTNRLPLSSIKNVVFNFELNNGDFYDTVDQHDEGEPHRGEVSIHLKRRGGSMTPSFANSLTAIARPGDGEAEKWALTSAQHRLSTKYATDLNQGMTQIVLRGIILQDLLLFRHISAFKFYSSAT